MAEKLVPPTVLVIFGITGDLSRRYLLPALAQIARDGHTESEFKIIGITRRDIELNEVLNQNDQALSTCLRLFKMDYDSAEDFKRLKAEIESVRQSVGSAAQVVFHLSVPPDLVTSVVEKLGNAKMNTEGYKLMMEKPFGRNLSSAQELVSHVSNFFNESQVFRIDHYLAKEMAQNIAVFLGGNAVFREVWEGKFIDCIEFIVSEQIGIEGRSGFYEQTGALRDIVQSHLLQLVALTLMKPCEDFSEFDQMPSRRLKVLKSLKVVPGSIVRGQYEGYASEVGNPDSKVETLVALELSSSETRWEAVPLKLSTGKNLDRKFTEIRVHFKRVNGAMANLLVLRIQPKEGIEFDLWVKEPGPARKLKKLPLSFYYKEHFDRLPDAYEQVLIDAMRGDHSLFASSDEVIASWEILEPVLKQWEKGETKIIKYEPGSDLLSIIG